MPEGERLSAEQTERLYGRILCPGSRCFRFRDPEVLPQTKQLLCPTSPSSLRDATSPSRGGFGRPLGFSSSPEAPLLGELSSGARLRGCTEERLPGKLLLPVSGTRGSASVEAAPLSNLSVIPSGCHLPRPGEARAFPPRSWLSLWESCRAERD